MNGDLQQRIEDHYEDPYHRGRCERPTHYSEAQNESCSTADSDVIAFELRITDSDQIEEAWFDGRGCKLSQAFASMLAEHVEGLRTETVVEMSVPQMLSTLNIDVDAAQHVCCKVALDALQTALNSPCEEDLEGPTFGGPDLGDEC